MMFSFFLHYFAYVNRRYIRLLILFATISICGIIFFQLFWVKKAYNLQEKQFNNRVHVALTSVASQIKKINSDSSELYEPVKQITSNYFIVSTNDTLHPYLLENLLTQEFNERNLLYNFEYVIYDCFNDSIVFGNSVDLKAEDRRYVNTVSENDRWREESHYFGVYFPEKRSYLMGEMEIWTFSSGFLLMVIIFFSYTIWLVLKQKRLSEIKTDFVNNMTHELKTPISTIMLATEVLSEPDISKDPERMKSYASIIREENLRLKAQVEKVLEIARLERKSDINRTAVDLHLLIEETVQRFSTILKSKNAEVNLELNAEKSVIMGDKTHLSNIIFNLIDNAIKYSADKPVIKVSTTNEHGRIYLRVIDNGIGINKEAQKHIFEKFYRVPSGNLHNVKGFGIGLNYVKKMVKKHHGSIRLKSELGQGTTFKLFFPLKN